MKHVIYSQMTNFFDSYNFSCRSQRVIHRGRSCETKLATFTQDLNLNLDCHLETNAIASNCANAFGRMSHQPLILKSLLKLHLHIFGQNKQFLTDYSHSVIVNDASSNLLLVSEGVPRGSVLGPLFFLIYINDPLQHLSFYI